MATVNNPQGKNQYTGAGAKHENMGISRPGRLAGSGVGQAEDSGRVAGGILGTAAGILGGTAAGGILGAVAGGVKLARMGMAVGAAVGGVAGGRQGATTGAAAGRQSDRDAAGRAISNARNGFGNAGEIAEGVRRTTEARRRDLMSTGGSVAESIGGAFGGMTSNLSRKKK